MDASHWERVFELFDAALARPAADRAALLSDRCGEDARLRQEVESLLEAHGDAEGFLSDRPPRPHAKSGDQPRRVPPALTHGTRLGVFDVETFVGAGGMGEVYKARDTRLDRHVAIKVLSPDLATDPRGRARLTYEARAIARLAHPRICSLHEMGHHEGIDFLVMEYLEGETLASRLRKGRLPLAQALRTAVEIGEALAAAHAQGIVHRDLKPGNVMLTRGGAKLLDFGLARLRVSAGSLPPTASHAFPSGATGRGGIVGTLPYMAPEQLEGQDVDARADIFAFGAVLFEMFTGRKAFEGTSDASVISAILSFDPPPVTVLQPLAPAALEHVIQRFELGSPAEALANTDGAFQPLLLAQVFDQSALELRGNATAVAHGVGLNPVTNQGLFSVSESGTLVYIAGAAGEVELVWFDRDGRRVGNRVAAGVFNGLSLSGDGTAVVYDQAEPVNRTFDLWRLEFASGTPTKLTFHPSHDLLPIWSPDGTRIAFSSIREPPPQLFTVDPERAGTETRLFGTSLPATPSSWSGDGRLLVYTQMHPQTGGDIWVLPLIDGLEPYPVIRTPADERYGALSPDGRWLAYISNETGTYEVYVESSRPQDSSDRFRWTAAPSRTGVATAASSSIWRPIEP